MQKERPPDLLRRPLPVILLNYFFTTGAAVAVGMAVVFFVCLRFFFTVDGALVADLAAGAALLVAGVADG